MLLAWTLNEILCETVNLVRGRWSYNSLWAPLASHRDV